jgi:hypothetical protein
MLRVCQSHGQRQGIDITGAVIYLLDGQLFCFKRGTLEVRQPDHPEMLDSTFDLWNAYITLKLDMELLRRTLGMQLGHHDLLRHTCSGDSDDCDACQVLRILAPNSGPSPRPADIPPTV